jgi:hypothetical protein
MQGFFFFFSPFQHLICCFAGVYEQLQVFDCKLITRRMFSLQMGSINPVVVDSIGPVLRVIICKELEFCCSI